MTNTKLNVDINSGAWTGSSAGSTIASLASDSLIVSTPFTPDNAAVATYNVVRNLSADNPDDVPANNSFAPISFATTNFIYARDNNTTSGYTNNATDGFETGNFFDIYQDQELTAVNVKLATGTVEGTSFYANIYEVDAAGDFLLISGSNIKESTTAMVGQNVILPLTEPLLLTANKTYLAVVGSQDAGLRVVEAGISDPFTSFFLDLPTGTWYYQTGTPFVRLNFDPSASLEETSRDNLSASIYPNPSTSVSSVSFKLSSASYVKVTVTDVTGKNVAVLMEAASISGDQKISFDTSSYANGAYYVTIVTENSIVTKKLIKK
jgi:hypothetical protein